MIPSFIKTKSRRSGEAGNNGHDGDHGTMNGLVGLLVNLLVAEKSGFQLSDHAGEDGLKAFADKMTRQMIETMQAEKV